MNIKKLVNLQIGSIDLFHDEEFRESHYNTMIELSTPHELFTWMRNNIRYGWRSNEDHKKHGTGADDSLEYFCK